MINATRLLRWMAATSLALLAGLGACGGGGGGGDAGSGQGGSANVASITLSPTSATVTIGANTTITAVARDAQGSALTGVSFTWSSSNGAIAQVSATGMVTGMAPGSAVITASANGATSNAAVITVLNASPGSPTDPTTGASGVNFHISGGSQGASMSLPAMTTQTGSTIVAFVGRGSVFLQSSPFDNKGNAPYPQVGPNHEYAKWPGEGTALYVSESITGGPNHVISVEDSNRFDEVSFAAVEVRNGGRLQAWAWNEVLNASSQTSASVTTTGPATLVAAWFGDDASSVPSIATPSAGFNVVASVSGAVETVQMHVATRDVSAAGTYTVTWTATPRQGAQLYLVAVQKR